MLKVGWKLIFVAWNLNLFVTRTIIFVSVRPNIKQILSINLNFFVREFSDTLDIDIKIQDLVCQDQGQPTHLARTNFRAALAEISTYDS